MNIDRAKLEKTFYRKSSTDNNNACTGCYFDARPNSKFEHVKCGLGASRSEEWVKIGCLDYKNNPKNYIYKFSYKKLFKQL